MQIDNERVPVLADKSLEIVCRAEGARPEATISWFRGSARLRASPVGSQPAGSGPSNFRLVHIRENLSADSNVTTSTLTIVPQVEDSGQVITCQAEGAQIAAESSSRRAPSEPSGAPIGSGGARESNAGEPEEWSQRPLASSGPGGGQPLEDSWRLEVHYLPRVKLALGDKLANKPVRELHDVYFECSVEAQPQAHELRWWHQGKELESNVSLGVIVSNQSLVLQRIKRHQAGQYTCSALNSVGEAHSNTVELIVEHAPYCAEPEQGGVASEFAVTRTQAAGGGSPRPVGSRGRAGRGAMHKKRYGAARMEPVKVYCRVEANPSEALSYRWAFVAREGPTGELGPEAVAAGEPEAEQRAQGRQEAGQGPGSWLGRPLVYLDESLVGGDPEGDPLVSVATYTARSELDYGSLLCWARNSLGEQQEPCVYELIAAEPPEQPRNCRLLRASQPGQLAVACQPGYDGGQEQALRMEVYAARPPGQLVANLTGSAPGQLPEGALDLTSISGDSDTPSDETVSGGPALNDQQPGELPAAPTGSGRHAASLVSEAGPRQPKQRHSHSGTVWGASSAATGRAQAALSRSSNEALFLTAPNQLSADTEYLLSIYAMNARGASRPVALRARTANRTTWADTPPAWPAGLAPLWPAGSGRTSGPAPLLNQVLALSWSPFLLVCAVTVAIFALFASITFALMKYVDLSGVLVAAAPRPPGNSSKPDEPPDEQRKCGGGGGGGSGGGGELGGQQQRVGVQANAYVSSARSSQNNSCASSNESSRHFLANSSALTHTQGGQQLVLLGRPDSASLYSASGGRGARVIALASAEESHPVDFELGLNGDSQREAPPPPPPPELALGHDYIRISSALAGAPSRAPGLRQSSSSDNFLKWHPAGAHLTLAGIQEFLPATQQQSAASGGAQAEPVWPAATHWTAAHSALGTLPRTQAPTQQQQQQFVWAAGRATPTHNSLGRPRPLELDFAQEPQVVVLPAGDEGARRLELGGSSPSAGQSPLSLAIQQQQRDELDEQQPRLFAAHYQHAGATSAQLARPSGSLASSPAANAPDQRQQLLVISGQAARQAQQQHQRASPSAASHEAGLLARHLQVTSNAHRPASNAHSPASSSCSSCSRPQQQPDQSSYEQSSTGSARPGEYWKMKCSFPTVLRPRPARAWLRLFQNLENSLQDSLIEKAQKLGSS